MGIGRRSTRRLVAALLTVGLGLTVLAPTADAGPAPAGEATARRDWDSLIGTRHVGDRSPVPGWTFWGGQLVTFSPPEVGLSVYRTPARRLVFLSEVMVRRQPNGVPVWEIRDTATTDAQVGPYAYVAPRGSCRDGSSMTLSDVTGVAAGTRPLWNPAKQLWTLRLSDGRLSRFPIRGVTCATAGGD